MSTLRQALSLKAKAYIAAVIALGALALAHALTPWQVADPARFACYLVLAMVSSRLKVSLPSVTGTLSVFFVFVLYGVLQMAPCETFAIGAAAVLVQSCLHNRCRPRLYQVLFNLGVVAIATQASLALYGLRRGHASDSALLLAAAAVALFVMNTLPVALVIALTEGKRAYAVWRASYFWSFPFYLAGAAVAAVLAGLDRLIGWQTGLLILPVVYVTYRTYSVYLERVEDAKKHAEEVAALHLRTIEALALAIEAKDNTTHSHLRRVQIYALELGRALGLNVQELEALRAASLLHDIGKLAVPEHIISKPGRLTPEEFEKLKVHPVVGAEILEHVRFPYPVTPIVRSHHEKWDGSGYPDGLAGNDIPIGARIIAAVDCLDALASDRQYRRALPLDQAMERVEAESGRSFDPAVVRLLAEHYDDWEAMAQPGGQQHHLSTDVKVMRGAEPAAGFEAASVREDLGMPFTDRISAARQEVQSLYELAQDLGSSLSLTETLSLFALRLAKLVSYDALAVYVDRGGTLKAEYVTGEDFRILSSLEIPVGQGLSGWVAENGKAIVNGNPAVEPGYASCGGAPGMRSTLAVPLLAGGVNHVLALYSGKSDAFNSDHLRVLMAVSPKLGLCIANALEHRRLNADCGTDTVTGLPNARALFQHLDAEISRARRTKAPFAVLVCDVRGLTAANAGDAGAMGMLARTLRECCREYDYVAHIAGGEFVVVMPGAGVREAQGKLDSLAGALDGQWPWPAAMAYAVFPQDGTEAESLLAAADARLFAVAHGAAEELQPSTAP